MFLMTWHIPCLIGQIKTDRTEPSYFHITVCVANAFWWKRKILVAYKFCRNSPKPSIIFSVPSTKHYLGKLWETSHSLEAGARVRGAIAHFSCGCWGGEPAIPFFIWRLQHGGHGGHGDTSPAQSIPGSTEQASPVPCNFWLYSVLSDWLLLKLPWSPAVVVLSTTGSVLLLCPMYSLFLSRVKFLFLPPVPSLPGQSMLATDSLAWW